MEFADLLAKVKPVTRSVSLCLSGDLIAEKERTERELLAARAEDDRHNRPPEAPAIARRIRELEEEIDASLTEFVVQSVGRTDWEGLIDRHPAGDREKELGLSFGPGFVTESIALSCIEPAVMTVDQVSQLEEVLSASQLQLLFSAVMAVNTGSDRLPKSVAATATLAASEPKSNTQRPSESLGASS
jgi:hypothetical protein